MLSGDADIIDEHVCLLRPAEYVLAVRQRDVALAKNDVIPPLTPRASLPAIQFLYHDQIQREEFLNLGGGASFALSDKVDLFGSMIHTVAKERKKGRTTNRPASRIQNSAFQILNYWFPRPLPACARSVGGGTMFFERRYA